MKDWNKIYPKYLDKLKSKLPAHLTYHCWQHTEHVIKMSEHIAREEKIREEDILLIKTAALFHDFGFIKSHIDHEERGIKYCSKRLVSLGYSDKEIDIIAGLIRATRIPQQCNTKLEEVLADADLEYLGTDSFLSTGNKLYEELKYLNPEFTFEEWNQLQISFMQSHDYNTDYCKRLRTPKKLENLALLIENA